MIRAILTSGSMRSLRHKPDRSCATKPGHISCHRHEKVTLLALDPFTRIIARRVDRGPPFFSALHALAVNDRDRRACVPRGLLAALHVERVMNAIERAVPAPELEVVVHRRARRQVFGDS